MKMRAIYVFAFLLLVYASCFGQMTVDGLTPGKSTRAAAERVLGQPVRKVSETLVEYRPMPLTGKIFVQYRAGEDVAERIEVLCRLANSNCNDLTKKWGLQLTADPEAVKSLDDGKLVNYYRGPQYVVTTVDPTESCADCTNVPFRIAFYSKELYAVTVAKALQEMSVEGVDVTDPGYEDITGVVKLRGADGSLRPITGAAVTFCWPPTFIVCYASTKTNARGMFSSSLLKGTYVAVVTGPGLKWNHRESVKIPLASALEFVAEPGNGAVPTALDLEKAVRKN
jgi:hypothetical protein